MVHHDRKPAHLGCMEAISSSSRSEAIRLLSVRKLIPRIKLASFLGRFWYPRPDSNRNTQFRKLMLYPLELQGHLHQRNECESVPYLGLHLVHGLSPKCKE